MWVEYQGLIQSRSADKLFGVVHPRSVTPRYVRPVTNQVSTSVNPKMIANNKKTYEVDATNDSDPSRPSKEQIFGIFLLKGTSLVLPTSFDPGSMDPVDFFDKRDRLLEVWPMSSATTAGRLFFCGCETEGLTAAAAALVVTAAAAPLFTAPPAASSPSQPLRASLSSPNW